MRRRGGPLHLWTFLLQHKNRKNTQITCMHTFFGVAQISLNHFNSHALPAVALFTAFPLLACWLFKQHECMFLSPGSQRLLQQAWVSCSQRWLWVSSPSVQAWLAPLILRKQTLCSGCTVICFAKKKQKWRVRFKSKFGRRVAVDNKMEKLAKRSLCIFVLAGWGSHAWTGSQIWKYQANNLKILPCFKTPARLA